MRAFPFLIPILLAAGPVSAQGPFRTWSGFDTSLFNQALLPYASTLSDLDGDGDVDAAFVHNGSALVTVIRNRGAAGFAQPEAYAIANASQCVIAADFDGDGRRDLVAADYGSYGEGNKVSLLRNTGTSFAPSVPFATGSGSFVGPVGLAAADFDGDGLLDLAVANYGYLGQGSTIALLRNNGSGGFLAPVAFAAGVGPWKLAAGDLDGDGDIDLAVARDARRISILRNLGGAFAAPEEYTVLSGNASDAYRQIALSDVDNDGDLDVLYASNGMYGAATAVIALYRNPGSGTFTAAESISLDAFSGSPTDLAVADVTGDGFADALVADHQGWTLVPNDGSGGFLAARPYRAGQGPIAIAAADMDGDGDLDPVVTNRDSLELTIHWNDGAGNSPVPSSYAAGSLGNSIAWGDVDQDGDLDVAVSYGYTGAGGVLVLLNQGNGAFGTAQDYPGPPAAMAVKLRDLNGDGSLDLLWADNAPPYDYRTRLNLGNGTFGAVTTWFVHTCGSGDVDAFDIDNDGDLDVFMTEYLGCGGGSGSHKVYIRKNQGNGSFDPAYALVTYLNTEIVGHGDLNGDGNQDLVVTSDGVEVYLGNGDGTFQPRMMFATDWAAKHMVIADLSGDGVPDIATYNFGSGGETLSVLIGNGNGSFQTHVDYFASYSPDLGNPEGIRAVDVDGDGDLDLFGGNYGSGDVSLYVNHGNGTFEPQVRFGAGMTTLDIAVADFTGDGLPDIAALVGMPPSGLGTAVAILEGRNTSSPVVSFCFGDGSGTACPCGNNGALGAGCANSVFAGGAMVSGSGYAGASAGTDTLVLRASNLTGPGLFFQGSGVQGSGNGVVFGDGLLCAGGAITRLGVVFPIGGSAAFPGGTTPSAIHVAGAPIVASDVRHYQCWYRDASNFCTASTFGLTQGLTVTWGP